MPVCLDGGGNGNVRVVVEDRKEDDDDGVEKGGDGGLWKRTTFYKEGKEKDEAEVEEGIPRRP